MNQHYQVRQCTAADCRLRFPARADQLPTLQCPRCGAATLICVEVVAAHEGTRGTAAAANAAAGNPLCSDDGAGSQERRRQRCLTVVVDNVRSLFNVGSIFRSADGAGVAHLHLCGITPTPENPKLGKTALGAELTVPWSYHKNSLDCIAFLRRAGYLLWALEEERDAISIFQAPVPPQPLALIIGNEVTGIDPALRRAADAVVALPMYGAKRSLNVATAFGAAVILLTHRINTEAPNPQPIQSLVYSGNDHDE